MAKAITLNIPVQSLSLTAEGVTLNCPDPKNLHSNVPSLFRPCVRRPSVSIVKSPGEAALEQSGGRQQSELQFQGQLNRARAADLIKRVQAAESAPQHLQRLPEEIAVIERTIRVGKIRVVEDVEEIGSELQVEALCQMKPAA